MGCSGGKVCLGKSLWWTLGWSSWSACHGGAPLCVSWPLGLGASLPTLAGQTLPKMTPNGSDGPRLEASHLIELIPGSSAGTYSGALLPSGYTRQALGPLRDLQRTGI